MRYARLGRCIYAVGGNPRAAHLSGIDVRRTQFLAFTIAGLMAAAGAILMAARLNSGSPNYGAGLELQAIAAAVIGGASLAGGRGHVLATLLGALTITIVQNGLNLNGVPTSAAEHHRRRDHRDRRRHRHVAHRAWSGLQSPVAREGFHPDPQGGRLMTYPRCFSHIGISVTDLEQAVEFYSKALGLLCDHAADHHPPRRQRHRPDVRRRVRRGLGASASLICPPAKASASSCSSSRNAERRADNFEYWKTGIFHFCVKDPDVEGLVKRIEEHGGRQRMKQVRYYYPARSPTAWSTARTRSATSSRSTATPTS